jgi:RNA-binding protein YhbY
MVYSEEFKRVLLGEPHCILGKKGITEEFIDYVIKTLKTHKMIKIKVLKSIADKSSIKIIANKICEKTDTTILDIRGRMIILSKIIEKKII